MSTGVKDEGEKYEIKHYCKGCFKEIRSPKEFRTHEAQSIYHKTGLCQECQDRKVIQSLKQQGFFKRTH